MQARAAETMAGAAPQVQRNKGSMGSKDLHLENFSVSNGGQELIEVCLCPKHPHMHVFCLHLLACQATCCFRHGAVMWL